MKKILFFLSILPSISFASNYVLVDQTSEEDVYLDKSSIIKITDDYIQAKYKRVVNNKDNFMMYELGDYVIETSIYDCHARTIKGKRLQTHTKENGYSDSNLVADFPAQKVRQNSSGELRLEAVCTNQR